MGNEEASTEMPKTLDENMNVIDEERAWIPACCNIHTYLTLAKCLFLINI